MGTLNRLYIVGPYPPPFGGISVHISRMANLLGKKGIPFIIQDQYGKRIGNHVRPIGCWLRWLFSVRKYSRNDLVHIHFPSTTLLPFYILFFVFCRLSQSPVIISLHNEAILDSRSLYLRFLIKLLRGMRLACIIAASDRVADLLQTSGLRQTMYLPAYVPHLGVGRTGPEPVDSGVATTFMNVWRIKDESFIQKYGVDLFLGVAARWPQDRFEIFLGDSANKHIVRKLCEDMGLCNVTIHVGKYLSEHFQYCDIFLRPNRADAYGVSIKEALDAGVPSIASNVCRRPAGSCLFASGDLEALDEAYILVRSTGRIELLADVEKTDYHLRLLDLYQLYLRDKKHP